MVPTTRTRASSAMARWMRRRESPSSKPATWRWGVATPSASGGEVLGADLVDELAELLDDVLALGVVHGVVLDDGGRLVDDLLRGEDRRAHPHGQGDGIGGAT